MSFHVTFDGKKNYVLEKYIVRSKTDLLSGDVILELRICDLNKSTTILDLQNQIYDETNISPDRQLLYFLGILLNPFQDEILLAFVQDIEALGLKPEFDLIQYSAGPNDESKWLITGKPQIILSMVYFL